MIKHNHGQKNDSNTSIKITELTKDAVNHIIMYTQQLSIPLKAMEIPMSEKDDNQDTDKGCSSKRHIIIVWTSYKSLAVL